MSEPLPSIVATTATLERQPSLLPLYWDAVASRLWMEVGLLDEEFLYVDAATISPGLPELRVDRNQLAWRRSSATAHACLLIQRNAAYQPSLEAFDQESRQPAVEPVADAFPQSVLWSFAIATEEEDHLLVDATDFFVRDATGLVGQLSTTDQGSSEVDPERCAIHAPSVGTFPDNTEVEALVSAVSAGSGRPGASTSAIARQRDVSRQAPRDGCRACCGCGYSRESPAQPG